jgi:F0F1-type ATP synthase membrane subunit c/vacuolar-type H+-ATPase subunit K
MPMQRAFVSDRPRWPFALGLGLVAIGAGVAVWGHVHHLGSVLAVGVAIVLAGVVCGWLGRRAWQRAGQLSVSERSFVRRIVIVEVFLEFGALIIGTLLG